MPPMLISTSDYLKILNYYSSWTCYAILFGLMDFGVDNVFFKYCS